MTSSAPHLYEASTRTDLVDWGVQGDAIEGVSRSTGRLIHKGPDNRPETGIWVCSEGRCTYVHESGEVIEIVPDTVAFFPEDWKGVCTVHETIKKVYMIR